MVARVFTLYNIDSITQLQDTYYYTLGFFDYFKTESISYNNKYGILPELWNYTYKLTKESRVENCSYQNIFAFTEEDEKDAKIWDNTTVPSEKLLKILIMVQCIERKEQTDIKERKEQIVQCLSTTLNTMNVAYDLVPYYTLDRNDFIISIGIDDYKSAMCAIKDLNLLHFPVCCYSIVGVSGKVVSDIRQATNKDGERYFVNKAFERRELDTQMSDIDSICIKGVFNSNYISALKSKEFIHAMNNLNYNLKFSLYEDISSVAKDACIYDIMGEEDIRFIAREVKLSRLIGLMHPNSALHSSKFLSSSHTVINIKDDKTNRTYRLPQNPPKHSLLKYNSIELTQDIRRLETILDKGYVKSIYHILKALSSANTTGTKKLAVALVFAAFVDFIKIILASYTSPDENDELEDISGYISAFRNTLYGIMQSDIRFYKLADFNTDLCYPPLKLSTLYMVWLDKLLLINRLFSNHSTDVRYKSLITFGYRKQTIVKHIKHNSPETNYRLILCEIPEENIYTPHTTLISLAHEASHFGFGAVRDRLFRYNMMIEVLKRAFLLYFRMFVLEQIKDNLSLKKYLEVLLYDTNIYTQMERVLEKVLNREEANILMGDIDTELYTERLNEIFEQKFAELNTLYEDIYGIIRNKISLDTIDFQSKNWENDWVNLYDISSKIDRIIYHSFMDAIDVLSDAYDIYSSLFAECFSDIIAILLLHLEQKDYIAAIEDAQLITNWEDFDELSLTDMRVFLVRQALSTSDDRNISTSWSSLNNISDYYKNILSEYDNSLYDMFSYYDSEVNLEQEFLEDVPSDYFNVILSCLLDRSITNILIAYLRQCVNNFLDKKSDLYKKSDCIQHFVDIQNIFAKLQYMFEDNTVAYIHDVDSYLLDFIKTNDEFITTI